MDLAELDLVKLCPATVSARSALISGVCDIQSRVQSGLMSYRKIRGSFRDIEISDVDVNRDENKHCTHIC